MKIEKLVIYGFGQHEQKTVYFTPGMNIIYGKNEAGKTTIQQFILHILFGFPPKNSPTLRYEPKSGDRYGGQIHLQDDTFGKCIIERIRGKSAGDVTVYFADGRTGGETELAELLRQYDRTSFEAIFSFSLFQLQGFEKMDEEQLSRTLFATGTTGMDRLLQIEKKLTKEMGDLYKKSGRIPSINMKMDALRELEKELEQAQQESRQYGPTMERLTALEREIDQSRKEIATLQQQQTQLEQLKQMMPLYEQREILVQQREALGNPSFPADGIRRYEMIAGRLAEVETQLQQLQHELAEQEKWLSEQVNRTTLGVHESLLAQEAEWHRFRHLTQQLTQEQQTLEDEIFQLQTRLGLQREIAIESFDLSLQQEERLHKYVQQFETIDQQLKEFERQQIHLTNEQNHLLDEERIVQQEAPSNKEREIAKQWPSLRQRLAEAKAYRMMTEQVNSNPFRTFAGGMAFLAIVLMAIGWWTNEKVLFVGISFALLAAYFWFQFTKRGAKEMDNEEWNGILATYEGKEEEMEGLVNRVQRYEQKIQSIHHQQQQVERKREIIEREREDLCQTEHALKESFQQFLFAYPFTELPAKSVLPELFRLLRELQEKERALFIAKQQLDEVIEQKKTIFEAIQSLLLTPVAEDYVFEALRTDYLRKKEQIATFEVAIRKKEELIHKEAQQLALVTRLQQERQRLLDDANVDTEEAYYEAYTKNEKNLLLDKQIDSIEAQLNLHNPELLAQCPTQTVVIEEIERNAQLRNRCEELLQQQIEERAQLTQKVEHLLTNEDASKQLQLFEMKKAELEEEAMNWSVRKLLTSAIEQMMTDLKEHRLPEVLQLASKLFQELTVGRYAAITNTDDGRFEVVTSDGIHVKVVELSQATKEQAYVSMRLALAKVLKEKAPFPLLLDDPFVHFDQERFSHIMKWLDRFQQEYQILFFTCHEDRFVQSSSAHIIHVSTLGTEEGAVTK